MSKLEKFQTLIVFFAVLLGLLLGQVPFIESYAGNFVIPFLFVMLFGLFLNIPLKDLKKSFLNFKFAITVISVNFLWTPILVWGLGGIFLSENPALWIGFIMLMVTPCTDWYLVFTGIAKGNVPLSTSILPINLILQVVLLPAYLFLFAGITGTININALFESILTVIILPFLLAQAAKAILRKIKDHDGLKNKVFSFFSSAQTVLLGMAIASMFAYQGRNLLANLNIVYLLLIPILLFYIINFLLAQFISKMLKYSYEDSASLTFTTVAKNSPMTLGIAVMVFPDEPVIALAMIIEPLIELPVMLLIARSLLLIRKKKIK